MRGVRISAVAALLLVTGCELPGGSNQQTRLDPTAQRMQAAYADLESGRFIVLADFEKPGDAELFRLVSAGVTAPDERQPQVTLRSSSNTGVGALQASLSGPDDSIWLDGQRPESAELPRDWREYALLIASIHGPPGGALLEFTIHSGTSTPLIWSTKIRIQSGWNLVRVDLAEPGPSIDPSHIGAVVWAAPDIKAPIDLKFDDVLLADNTRWILPASDAPNALYVQSRGKRIYVGAPERFELAFADGVITAWHPSRDARSVNLTVASGLGPWPVALDATWATATEGLAYDDPSMFANWGETVAAGQAVVEASAFRVVMLGRWRFMPSDPQATTQPASPPGHVWQYTIYPSGRIYVRLVSDPADAAWTKPLLGAAVALDAGRGFELIQQLVTSSDSSESQFVLLSPKEKNRPDLLWAPYNQALLATRRVLESGDGRRLAVVAGAVSPKGKVESAHLIRVWPADMDGTAVGDSIAWDYRHPAAIAATVGRLVTDSAGDLDGDGFNESEGCYELSPEGGVLRFRFDPGRRLRYRPIFRIHETGSRRCWVYVDGRIIKNLQADGRGRMMFRIDDVVQHPLAFEIYVRPR